MILDAEKTSPVILSEAEWLEREAAHHERVRPWVEPHLARAKNGVSHPVLDFLFTYYPFRAAHLMRWHPGPGVKLQGTAARRFLRWPEYEQTPEGVALNLAAWPQKRLESLRWISALLRVTHDRPGFFGCYGLHEWAMVYKLPQGDVRHAAWPLRLSPEALAKFVESQAICCTHFDAFRFFTQPARPLNRLQPTRADSLANEQRACLHANMDLYKWAFKLSPFTPAELLADAFELAREIRTLDMRASPYDFTELGYEPIAIETPAGRSVYEEQQRKFSERSQPIRKKLHALTEQILARRDREKAAPQIDESVA